MWDKTWEDRWTKLSPEMEEKLELMVQDWEASEKIPQEHRENYKATLRYLVVKTMIYDL